MIGNKKISACIVVYNEEKVIRRCLESIKSFVDEIIVVHDGECSDNTLDIAREYTSNIFIKPHIGEAEEHRVFAMSQAQGEWILQIDGDEYFDSQDIPCIKEFLINPERNGFYFKWELWNGKHAVYFKGLQKLCLFKRNAVQFVGVPHEAVKVEGGTMPVDIFLRHRPVYNNISWKSFWKKKTKWVPIHAEYFFPEKKTVKCFNTTANTWNTHVNKVRAHVWKYIVWTPLKMWLGQMKNGLWTSRIGFQIAAQQYIYYLSLYWCIWKMNKKLKSLS